MSLATRRIIYIFFIIAFLVITPSVCFYAAGYKIGPHLRLQKTGSLVLETKPKGAQIYLNGKIQRNFIKKFLNPTRSYITTPTKIKRLQPGEYKVKLTLPNYWPWQKKITIHPGKITLLENITLFKKNLPLILLPGQFTSLSFSPNKKHFFAVSKQKIIWMELEKEKIHTYATSTPVWNANTTPLWSSSEKKIIFNNLIFNLNNWPQAISYFIATNTPLTIKWADNKDDVILYKVRQRKFNPSETNKEIIYQYNLNSGQRKKIAAGENISDFIEKNGHVFIVKQEKLKTALIITNNGQKERKINLPYASYTFLNPEHQLINLYDRDHKILYLIDPVSYQSLKEVLTNVNKTAWLDDNKLLYANDFEIWLLNLKNGQKMLLTRLSQPIVKIIAHPNGRYLIYSTATEINIIELSFSRTRNVVNLIKLPLIRELALDSSGKTLYFYAQIGQQKGIYKLAIQ